MPKPSPWGQGRQEVGISVPGLVRDMLVRDFNPGYNEAVKFSEELDQKLKEVEWLLLYDGTTFTKSFEPGINPKGTVKLVLGMKMLPTGEFKVKWIENGVLDEPKSYYTEDYQDALDTLRAMENEAIRLGYKVEVKTGSHAEKD